jgi:hypothetical protein
MEKSVSVAWNKFPLYEHMRFKLMSSFFADIAMKIIVLQLQELEFYFIESVQQ